MTIQQKSLFGAPSSPVQAVKPPKPMAAPRAPLPSLDLTYGFDNTEIAAEAVFWHRLIINQQIRNIQDPKSRRRFTRAVLSEMKLKQGRSSPLNLMRDMLLMKNLG
jgi:hypothetical protein